MLVMKLSDQTGEIHGDAWGHFTVVGRVRYWDGLIVLLHTPVGENVNFGHIDRSHEFRQRDPNGAHLGQWIFRGYLHDRNFVGRWRETSTPIDVAGFEGSFVVCKVEE